MTLSLHTRCAVEPITRPYEREIQKARRTITDHGFVIETLAVPGSHGGSRCCEIREDDECLATHFCRLKRDNIEDCAIRKEQSIELCSEFLLVDRVV